MEALFKSLHLMSTKPSTTQGSQARDTTHSTTHHQIYLTNTQGKRIQVHGTMPSDESWNPKSALQHDTQSSPVILRVHKSREPQSTFSELKTSHSNVAWIPNPWSFSHTPRSLDNEAYYLWHKKTWISSVEFYKQYEILRVLCFRENLSLDIVDCHMNF